MPTPQRLFRHKHPLLFCLLLLGVISLVFWGGITFFVSSVAFQSPQSDLFGKGSGIGVIELEGVIVSAEETVLDIAAFREDDKIKAIVVRIDSPGGTVGASQEIYRELKKTSVVKPVIASMGSVAASGGYYAALGAQQIMASTGTLTGSIGVILQFANFQEIFNKIGYKSEVIKSGEHKDIGSASRSMTDEERALLQVLIDNVHNQFIDAVATERKLNRDDVVLLADGQIFSGTQALESGLIDKFGNFADAVILAAQLAGMDTSKMPALIYPEEDDFSLLRLVTGKQTQAGLQNLFGHYPAIVYEWSMVH